MPDYEARWYVVHTYSGYENKVAGDLMTTAENRQLQDKILVISIPTETVTEKTEKGELKTYERKLYPSYLFVKMVYSDETWHVIRNVRGVSGFVGASGNDPIPLSDDEVYEMGVEKREIVVNYAVGDTVRILDGPLTSFTGTVESIEVENNAVNVVVSMFGRETSVEFELDQVEVVSQ
jgi:transcriptional antiterminator NusG